jgi:hypothetical protein
MTYDRTVNEFVELIKPEVERDVFEQIKACDDPAARRLLMRHRSLIVKIANLERRLAEAEERLRPRLVEN